MKQLLILFIGFLAISFNLNAQSCNPFFNYTEGTMVELTHYNAKGKEETTQKMIIKSVSSTGSGQAMIADITISDKKDKEVYANEVELACENGVFKMDMSSFIPPTAQATGMEDVKIVFEGDYMSFPSSLSVGSSLDDVNFVMKMESENPALAAVMGKGTSTSITNRKVVSKESLTTPAGTFDCYKITYDSRIETQIMGLKKVFETSTVEWISEGAGIVKTESYDKKGKLDYYTELTAFHNQ
ncbi:TapB family protein [Chondrinema litorale]|uniref:TapB family protein n=1 Tax=Chondrinema litorale TaxID=2994555 RepID=UPI0025438724|nr:hypothetical protein [Chondrinema litorale]UZR92629.1 hypothetical protein OQ292_12255 [Chondrinema litorale]